MLKPLITTLIILFCHLTLAEQKQVFNHYEVHYSAFNTLELTPTIAASYGIQRSDSVGLLNISVLPLPNNGKALNAQISGYANNLIGQKQNLEFRLISEQNSRYYLAKFRFSTEELLHFTLTIQPQGEKTSETIKFKKIFYQD